ncbi:MAG TPA: FG-GAP-like repeat-containing protein [Vicinamibacterales bacterium]|nr:FG-GAP-like repeat-containing protein [Vicinamibacterales bacterium]
MVTFNGTPATPTSWSATSIVVPVPSGATTGNVVMAVGGMSSNGQPFTVTAPATVALVQHVDVDAGSPTSASQAFPSANTGGNFIALAIRAGTPNQTFTISDTRGNVYRQAARFNNNSDDTVALYYAENIGAGANTVTITMPAAVSLRFSLFEYRGLAASGSLDGVSTAAGSGTSANSGAVTTTASGDLLIGVVSTANAANVAPGSSFAVEGSVPALPVAKLVVEDAVLATAGSIAGTASLSATDQWGAAIAAFRPATVNVAGAAMMSAATRVPTPDDTSRASDYDGDGKGDLAVFTPSTGKWSVLQSSSNYMNSFSLILGASTDVPVPGDYDGDGKTDAAVYTPSTGKWTVMKSSSAFASSMSATWGVSGDVPVPGDYDGDGKTDFAVYRPSTGEWWLTLSATQTTRTIVLGTSSDKPVAGDYDGDGRTDLAIFRPSTGTWIILTSSSNYASQITGRIGTSSDLLVPGDYDGDGRTDMAVYRPSSGSWLILGSSTGFSTTRTVTLGSSADIPVPSDYDADGMTDVAIYRPSTGQWSIIKSSDGSTLTSVWGTSGSDLPLPRHP